MYIISLYFCHLFLISSSSVRSLLFLSYFVPVFTGNVPLVSPIFLKRSLVFSFLFVCFPLFLCIDHLRQLSYLSLLFSETMHSFGYIFPFLFCPILFSAICKASSDNHFAFLLFFFFGMVSVTTTCTMLQVSVHSSSGTLPDLII